MEHADALNHELIHHFDYCSGKFEDVHGGRTAECSHLARSELRAALLSGECKFSREFLRGNIIPISKHLQVFIMFEFLGLCQASSAHVNYELNRMFICQQ